MSLPEAFTHQDKLLTVDTNLSKFLEGLLHPGIKAHPLFLDPYNGAWVLRVRFAPGVTLPLRRDQDLLHLRADSEVHALTTGSAVRARRLRMSLLHACSPLTDPPGPRSGDSHADVIAQSRG